MSNTKPSTIEANDPRLYNMVESYFKQFYSTLSGHAMLMLGAPAASLTLAGASSESVLLAAVMTAGVIAGKVDAIRTVTFTETKKPELRKAFEDAFEAARQRSKAHELEIAAEAQRALESGRAPGPMESAARMLGM